MKIQSLRRRKKYRRVMARWQTDFERKEKLRRRNPDWWLEAMMKGAFNG